MDIKKLIKKYLNTAEVMEFATCENNRPYVCSVHFAADEHFNLYWMSLRSTNHSQRLLKNKKTAAGILINPDKKICVHLEGEAFELSGEEAIKAHRIYSERYGQKDERLVEALSGNPKTRSYYIFKPSKLGLFDQENDADNPKRAIIL